jgi:hypothetical protein
MVTARERRHEPTRAGGGLVEGYPHEISDKGMSSSFLCNGTRGWYERVGFGYVRPKGLRNCVIRRSVDAVIESHRPAGPAARPRSDP